MQVFQPQFGYATISPPHSNMHVDSGLASPNLFASSALPPARSASTPALHNYNQELVKFDINNCVPCAQAGGLNSKMSRKYHSAPSAGFAPSYNVSPRVHELPASTSAQNNDQRICSVPQDYVAPDISHNLAQPVADNHCVQQVLPLPQQFVGPANTELEMVALDWYGKALGLPKEFLHSNGPKKGGGCSQGTASEAIFAVIMAARYRAIEQCLHDKEHYDFCDQWDVLKHLVSYTSKGAHTAIAKGAKMASVRMRLLDVDEKSSMRGDTVKQAIEADIKLGLIPCFVGVTLGTTGEAAYDNLKEIAVVCRDYPLIWLHVDAAYGGSLFVCPEFRYLLDGIEDACSINVNPNKWFLVNYDCSCVWLRDYQIFTEALAVNRLYLEHEWMNNETVNFHNWGTPLSRRFRVLKLWFTMRSYGIQGLQNYIRNHCNLALLFESLVRKDNRFEVMNEVKASLVCFRLRKLDIELDITEDEMTELLLAFMNSTGEVHMVPAHIRGYFSIRFCVVYRHATEALIRSAWKFIQECTTHIESFIKNQEDYPTSTKLDSEERTQMVNMVKKYAHTTSIPLSKFREEAERPSLSDCHMPVLVPETTENIVKMVNVSQLMRDVVRSKSTVSNV